MPRLSRATLKDVPAGVSVPRYLDDDVAIGIVHFGVGNFHRAHQAMYIDRLLNAGGAREWGICGIGLLDRDAGMRDALVGQDGLYSLTLRHPDGAEETSVIGSIRRFLHAPDDPNAVLEQLADPSVRIVSLTITEGSYVEDPTKNRHAADDPLVVAETAGGLSAPLTAFGWIAAGLRLRRNRGIAPFTVMSCDNVPGNGEVARRSVVSVARLADPDLADWIATEVAFPSTMVDRITPVTTQVEVDAARASLGLDDAWPVASEPFAQWVIEDHFPTGRPDYAAAGATLVDDVHAYETIKIRLLNGGHQAIAYVGQLAGHVFVHDALADARIARFVRDYMELEGVPTLSPPDGFDVPGYIDELFRRFSNANVADTTDRLGTDASNRIPTFVVPTLLDRAASGSDARGGARLLATWRGYEREAASGRFQPIDESADLLMAAAQGEPLAFLRALPTVAELAEHPSFVSAYLESVAELDELGVDGALTRWAPA
jgi:mannitol 2-dehydrogenase